MVPFKYEQDKSLGQWVNTQRRSHNKNTMRPDRKELLNKIGFAWKYTTLAARASTTDVRGLVICIISRFGQTDYVSHSRFFNAYLCRIRIRKRSPGPAVWVSQAKHHQKNHNLQKATLVITDSTVHLPTESDQWPLV
jgi:hypothetical protein